MEITELSVAIFLLLLQLASVGFMREVKIITPEYPDDDPREVIKIGVILPWEHKYPWAVAKTLPAIQYAVDTINHNQTQRLPNHVLRITIGDSKCSDTIGPLVAIDMYLKQTANVFVGPACDYSVAPIARFSPHWNIPLITGGALVQAFKDKMQYSQLTRISGSYAKLGSFFATLFRSFKFVQTALIYNNNLGQRAGKYGRTNCYFVMEAVYLALQIPFKAQHGNKEDLWSKPFDEKQPGTYNFTSILKEASQHARSEY